MASNLECVGLASEDRDGFQRLVIDALSAAEVIGGNGELTVHRWQDPSGVRLVVVTTGHEIVEFLPSYAGAPGPLAELEQRRLLPPTPVGGLATVVALGVDVAVHTDADTFAASDDSLVSPRSGDEPDEPPAHFVEQGWSWPPRMAANSFFPYGVFGVPEDAEAYARLNGTVLHAARRTVVATGQQFIAARVHCGVFETDVCLPVDADTVDPAPGNVVAGTVFLVASLVQRDRRPRR